MLQMTVSSNRYFNRSAIVANKSKVEEVSGASGGRRTLTPEEEQEIVGRLKRQLDDQSSRLGTVLYSKEHCSMEIVSLLRTRMASLAMPGCTWAQSDCPQIYPAFVVSADLEGDAIAVNVTYRAAITPFS